jgi:hypothetical protein
MITKTLRGGDIKVYINGKLFKPVISLSFSINSGHHSIGGIDINTPFELAPGPTRIRGNIELLRGRNDGGLEGQGVAAPNDDILLEKYFTLALIDRLTDSVMLYMDECVIIDQNWNVPSKNIVTGTATFEGIGWANEAS